MERNKGLLSILYYIGVYILVQLIGAIVVLGLYGHPDNIPSDSPVIAIINIGFYLSMTILIFIMFKQVWRTHFNYVKNNISKHVGYYVLGFLTMFGVAVLMNKIYVYFDIAQESNNQESLNQMMSGHWLNQFSLVFFAVLLAPIVEEFVFRFGIFNALKPFRKRVPLWVVCIISAFVFGFIHVGVSDFDQIYVYASLGLVLSVFYVLSKNIYVPILMHISYNLFMVISMFALYYTDIN